MIDGGEFWEEQFGCVADGRTYCSTVLFFCAGMQVKPFLCFEYHITRYCTSLVQSMRRETLCAPHCGGVVEPPSILLSGTVK